MGLDGKMKSSRGLGYESDKDLLNPEKACERFFECHMTSCNETPVEEEEDNEASPIIQNAKKEMEKTPKYYR
jgi:hypothetical protein